jgi:hypothetical protein
MLSPFHCCNDEGAKRALDFCARYLHIDSVRRIDVPVFTPGTKRRQGSQPGRRFRLVGLRSDPLSRLPLDDGNNRDSAPW